MTSIPRSSDQPKENPKPSPVGLLLFAWFFVGIPLIWGVTQTIIKSLPLFSIHS